MALSPSSTSSPRTPGLSSQRPLEDAQAGAQFDNQGGLPWAKPQRNDSLTIADYHHPPGFAAPRGEHEGWTSPGFAGHGPHSANSPYWPSTQSTPASAAFPPNTMSSLSQSHIPNDLEPHQQLHGGSHSWAPPTRSASYSQIEGVPNGLYQYGQMQSPSPLHSQNINSPFGFNSPTEHRPAQASQTSPHAVGGASGHNMPGYPYHQQWMPSPESTSHASASHQDHAPGHWYAEPGPMAQEPSEPHSQYSGMPPPFYPHSTG